MIPLADFTKFKLKPQEEILEWLKDSRKIFVIACKKCYKEFSAEPEKELSELLKILDQTNKTITSVEFDFLCNIVLTENKLKQNQENIKDADSIAVISCGIGVQNIADLIEEKPVYTMTDSVLHNSNATCLTAYHGLALYEKKCAACAQCYLNLTSGICPIVDCSKSLVNGPCGGAKNGKCEVKIDGVERDCAWEKIYKKLEKQNSISNILEVKVRDFSKPRLELTHSLSLNILEKRAQSFYGGVYPYENKEFTEKKPIMILPEPEIVVIPLSQHTGAVCEPLVKVGDYVKLGQKIADSKAFISAPIHSSVSGKVIATEPRIHPTLQQVINAIIIESDGKNELHETVKPCNDFEKLSSKEILDIIREKGIVGLGGAMFPTHVKLKPPKPVDTLILNGCECEPFLSADNRVMIERAEDVVYGMKIILKALGLNKGIIAIENNKPEAIAKIREFIANNPNSYEITVKEVKTKYPQGAERMLIKHLLKRDVPLGGLPFDVGVIVSNVSTGCAISDAFRKGLPLIERVITVAGKVKEPMNLKVKIGTSIKEIIDYCGGLIGDNLEIKMGGPMMGVLQSDLDVPVIKGTTGIVVVDKPDIEPEITRKCIKCGRCVDVCPMELYPLYFWLYANENKWSELKELVKNCIECGCCEYLCSSKLPLVSIVKKGKMYASSAS
ncbi:MAG: electron transport complex subunit RsxC [Candidatus Thermoplasmatota archaeon]